MRAASSTRALIAAWILVAAAPCLAGTPGEAALRAVAGPFLALETWSARFTQTQQWVGVDEPLVARGRIFLQRPRLFRIEYEEPRGHLQVSDGIHVWTYVPENQEVLKAALPGGADPGGDPLRTILERSEPDSALGTERLGRTQARILTLRPDPELGLALVRLWTAGDEPKIVQYEITESSGNLSLYTLSDVVENPRLDPRLFTFMPPPGVPVVEVGEP